MPRLPGHQYLGPGNSVRSGKPVDRDDEIAEVHDLAYELQPEDVSSADQTAVDDFIQDWQQNKNVHSLIGGIGIQTKRTFEGIFGQQYPMHGGKQDYQYATKRLSEIYREQKKTNPSVTWREFQKLHFGELMREHRGKRGYGQGSGGDTAGDPKRHREESPVAGPSGVSQRGTRDSGEGPIPGDDWDDILNTLGGDAATNMPGGDVESMETLANPSKGGGVSGHSHRGSGAGMIVSIPKVPRTPYYTKTYRKNWIFFSYGFAHKAIEVQNNIFYTTPLSLIPVDLLAFYVDQTEFSLLAGRAVAVHCNARVKPLGCRMNFQTSSTESKWATSEFVAIGQSAVGLNKSMPGINWRYNPDAAKPMIPTGIDGIVTNILHEKLYGDEQGRGAIQMVPRHLNLYFTPMVAKPRGNTNENRFTHNRGPPKIDQYIDRFLVNTCIGQDIVNYSYKIKNGIITDTYSADYVNYENYFRTASKAEQVKAVPFVSARGVAIEGIVAQQPQTDPDDINNWQSSFTSKLYQTLEHYHTYKWDSGHIHGNTQPQVHVGLTAVPAINPGSEATDFQNTSIYWSVETELIVHHYQNSCFHDGNIHTYAPYWYPSNWTKEYHNGNTYNGHANLKSNQFNSSDVSSDDLLHEVKGAPSLVDYEAECAECESIEMVPSSQEISEGHDTVDDNRIDKLVREREKFKKPSTGALTATRKFAKF